MDPTRSAKSHREPRSSRSIENSRNNEPVISLSSFEKYETQIISMKRRDVTERRCSTRLRVELYLFHNHVPSVSVSRRCLRREIRLKRELVTRCGLAVNNARKREKVARYRHRDIILRDTCCDAPPLLYSNYFRESFEYKGGDTVCKMGDAKGYFELVVEKRIIDARARDIGEAFTKSCINCCDSTRWLRVVGNFQRFSHESWI